MELDIVKTNGEKSGKMALPTQFNEEIRTDLIARAVLTIQSNKRQPYGTFTEAGKRSSSYVSKRRHDYKTTYGIGQSRTPRKVMSRRGTRMNWVGAFAPQTVGGRRAHPPKAEKIWSKSINKKERRKAIRSAMSATIIKEIVSKRNIIPKHYPFIIDNEFENIDKTKNVREAFDKIGLTNDLNRSEVKKVRSGKGKMRGRKYKKKIGPLIVVSKDCKLLKSGANIPGVNVVIVNNLNTELLAPGTQAGRLTLFTRSAIDKLEKEKLFL